MSRPAPGDLAVLHDPQTYVGEVPYDVLTRLRREHGVVRVEEPALPGWPPGAGYRLVLRHGDVRRVLSDPATFSSALGGTQIRDPASDVDLAFIRAMMLNMDPPEHARLRRLLSRSFTRKAVAALEDGIRGHARRLVDRMLDGPAEVDFAKDVAADLPLLALADILGVPAQDRWLMYDWSNRVIGWQDPDYAVSASFDATRGSDLARQALALRPTPDPDGAMPDPRSREGMPDLYAYAHLLGEAKRSRPGDDVMSILMSSVDTADTGSGRARVSLAEFENLFWLFAVAGNETLRNGLPGAMIALLQHPEAQQRLRKEPGAIPDVVDELLRWWTPVMTFRRTATTDTEIAGQPVSAGEKVVVSFASANRDETVFADPDAFSLGRALDGGARAQLAFGHGPHFCLGAQLARTQMAALFTELLTRTRSIEQAGEVALLRSNFQRGVKRLPIVWR